MVLRVLFASMAVAVAVFSAACDESLSSLTGPTPNLEPTFSSIQREIFDTTDASGRTSCVACHTASGRTPAGGLNLTSGNAYAALVGVSSGQRPGVLRVAAGDPDNSYLVRKLEGGPDITGTRMPRGTGPFLTQGQMLVLRRWIANGARND
jgi:mono/diheme cytochrome c family protein